MGWRDEELANPFTGSLLYLDAIGEDAKGKSLRGGHSFFLGRAIPQDTGQIWISAIQRPLSLIPFPPCMRYGAWLDANTLCGGQKTRLFINQLRKVGRAMKTWTGMRQRTCPRGLVSATCFRLRCFCSVESDASPNVILSLGERQK